MRSPYLRPITLGLATGLFVISAGVTGLVLHQNGLNSPATRVP